MWWPFKKRTPPLPPPSPELMRQRIDLLKGFHALLHDGEETWPFMAVVGFSDTPVPGLVALETPYTYKRWWDRDNAPRMPSFDEARFKRWHFTQVLICVNPTTGLYDLSVTLKPGNPRVREGHARQSLLCLQQSFDGMTALCKALQARRPQLDPQTHEMLGLFLDVLEQYLKRPWVV